MCTSECTTATLIGAAGKCVYTNATSKWKCDCPNGYTGIDYWGSYDSCHIPIKLRNASQITIIIINIIGISMTYYSCYNVYKSYINMKQNVYQKSDKRAKKKITHTKKLFQTYILYTLYSSFGLIYVLQCSLGYYRQYQYPIYDFSLATATTSFVCGVFSILELWYNSIPKIFLPNRWKNNRNMLYIICKIHMIFSFILIYLFIFLLPSIYEYKKNNIFNKLLFISLGYFVFILWLLGNIICKTLYPMIKAQHVKHPNVILYIRAKKKVMYLWITMNIIAPAGILLIIGEVLLYWIQNNQYIFFNVIAICGHMWNCCIMVVYTFLAKNRQNVSVQPSSSSSSSIKSENDDDQNNTDNNNNIEKLHDDNNEITKLFQKSSNS